LAVKKSIDSVAATRINTLQTTINIPSLSLDVLLQSNFYGINNNLVFAAKGAVSTVNKQPPPFLPNFIPPTSFFSNPKGQVNVILTSYFTNSSFWALNANGDFNRVITNDDFPANNTYKLSTNDVFFYALVPRACSLPEHEYYYYYFSTILNNNIN